MLDFRKCIIIAAHPDDEILWFSSAMADCQHVYICFGPANSKQITRGRKRAQIKYPLDNVTFMNLHEPGAFLKANWHSPEFGNIGLAIEQNYEKFERTYWHLQERLKSEITENTIVLTHNPWGEYGHEEHILVFEAVKALREKYGFDLYVSNYVSDRSHDVMLQRQVWIDGIEGPFETNQSLAQEITDLYIKSECWTFPNEYEWPAAECFLHITQEDQSQTEATILTATPPLNYLAFGFQEAKLKSFAMRKTPPSLKTWIKKLLGRG